MKSNRQKFVHYVMITFTYSIGIGTLGLMCFALSTVINKVL